MNFSFKSFSFLLRNRWKWEKFKICCCCLILVSFCEFVWAFRPLRPILGTIPRISHRRHPRKYRPRWNMFQRPCLPKGKWDFSCAPACLAISSSIPNFSTSHWIMEIFTLLEKSFSCFPSRLNQSSKPPSNFVLIKIVFVGRLLAVWGCFVSRWWKLKLFKRYSQRYGTPSHPTGAWWRNTLVEGFQLFPFEFY